MFRLDIDAITGVEFRLRFGVADVGGSSDVAGIVCGWTLLDEETSVLETDADAIA